MKHGMADPAPVAPVAPVAVQAHVVGVHPAQAVPVPVQVPVAHAMAVGAAMPTSGFAMGTQIV